MISFPNGDFEYHVTPRVTPSIGETVRRGGTLWSVTRVKNGGAVPTVYVKRVEHEDDEPSGEDPSQA